MDLHGLSIEQLVELSNKLRAQVDEIELRINILSEIEEAGGVENIPVYEPECIDNCSF